MDTLRLSPLAFPRNPYHHLVKHYQDGGLRRGRVNDPELDARLALEVFGDQVKKLRKSDRALLTAWHWLTTPEPEGADRALDDLFASLRRSRRPSDAEARAANLLERLFVAERWTPEGYRRIFSHGGASPCAE